MRSSVCGWLKKRSTHAPKLFGQFGNEQLSSSMKFNTCSHQQLAGHRLFLKMLDVHCMMVHVGIVLIRQECIGDWFDGNDCNDFGSALGVEHTFPTGTRH